MTDVEREAVVTVGDDACGVPLSSCCDVLPLEHCVGFPLKRKG